MICYLFNKFLKFIFVICTFLLFTPASGETQEVSPNEFVQVIKTLASIGDRSTGTPGCEEAAEYITDVLTAGIQPGRVSSFCSSRVIG